MNAPSRKMLKIAGSPMRREKGSVLITAMIFLMILTMIVLTVVGSGTLEERMAANDRNRQVGIQSAEAVVRFAEVNLFSAAPFEPFDAAGFTNNCTNGFCSALALNTDPRWQTMDWSSTTQTRTFSASASELAGLPSQPRYFVELATAPLPINGDHKNCTPGLAHITARGLGRDGATVYIQSSYRYQPASC